MFIFVNKDFEEIREYLYTLLNLSFNQVKDALCEVSIQGHALRGEVVVRGSFQTEEGLVVVFLLESKLCNLEEGVTSIEFLIWILCNLLKVENCISLL